MIPRSALMPYINLDQYTEEDIDAICRLAEKIPDVPIMFLNPAGRKSGLIHPSESGWGYIRTITVRLEVESLTVHEVRGPGRDDVNLIIIEQPPLKPKRRTDNVIPTL